MEIAGQEITSQKDHVLVTIYRGKRHIFQLRCKAVVLQLVVNEDAWGFFAISCKNRVISPWSLGYIPVLITTLCLRNSHCSFRWIVEFSSLPVINYSVVLLCSSCYTALLLFSASPQTYDPFYLILHHFLLSLYQYFKWHILQTFTNWKLL